MRDMVGSRKTILNSFRDVLIQEHPKLFNVLLIFALISLVVTGAFLLSDIMSFKSSPDQKGHISSLYPMIPKGNQTTIKSWQDIGTKLTDQSKSILGLKGPDKAAAKNRLAKAKEASTTGGNLSHLQIPTSPSNSSRTQKTVRSGQATSPALPWSTESEGGSSTPSYSLSDSSPKETESDSRVDAVTSNFSPNQPLSNEIVLKETVPNESIMNEPVLDASVLNGSILNESIMNESVQNEPIINKPAMNKSRINQSHRYANSSSNISESLPITDLGRNGSIDSSYSFVPRNTNQSIDDLSSGSPAFPMPQMNHASFDSTEIHESLAPDKNDSDMSAPQESDHENKEMNYQNETFNLNANDNSTQEKKTRNESLFIIYDQKNVTSDALESRRDNISSSYVPDKSSNITSRQINISLEGNTNSAPTREIIFANNSSNQIQEPKQNHINNQTESERNSGNSSLSLSPKVNTKTEGVQNHAGTNSKKISSGSGSARFQEPKKSQTNNVNRFKSLKVPTPSWMAKAKSMNKIKSTKK